MKVKSDFLILTILFISIMYSKGIIGEIIFWMCTIFLGIKNYGYYRRNNRKLIRKFIIAYLFTFLLLYIYICYNYKLDIYAMIRFMGYTKCICSIVIAVITFGISSKNINYINYAMMWTIIINITAYLEDIISGTVLDPELWYIGASSNILGGLNNIVLAFIFYKKTRYFSRLEKVFIFTSVLYILVSGSQTAVIMLLIQCSIKLITIINVRNNFGIIRKISLLLIGTIAILGIYLIVNYGNSIDNSGVLDRYNIWNRALEQFGQRTVFEKIFGTGNDIVQMQFTTFIPHNFVLEVMMLYGYVGICFIGGLLITAIFVILNIRNSIAKTSMTISLLMFICVIFFHPAFTTCLWLELLFYMGFLQYAYADDLNK